MLDICHHCIEYNQYKCKMLVQTTRLKMRHVNTPSRTLILMLIYVLFLRHVHLGSSHTTGNKRKSIVRYLSEIFSKLYTCMNGRLLWQYHKYNGKQNDMIIDTGLDLANCIICQIHQYSACCLCFIRVLHT